MMRLAIALVLAAASAPPHAEELAVARQALEQARTKLDRNRLAHLSWSSPELAGDLLGDPGAAQVAIHLPAREQACLSRAAKCWLVLYLPGFDASADSVEGFATTLEALDARAGSAPIVLVALDGRTRLGGGWYVDSRASGKWETVIREVLLRAARDALAPGTPPSRTLVMGHSMGGFGAIHLASAHPEAFRAFAAFNPAADLSQLGELAVARLQARNAPPDPQRLLDSQRDFYARILASLGAALEPDPQRPHGIPALIESAKLPWTLPPALRKALADSDETRHAARGIEGMVFAGARDPLIPPAELEPLRSKRVQLVVTDGNHVSHLAQDLRQALETLAH